jgi:hypothetical protein
MEATPSSNKEAPSNVAAHCAQEGIKGGSMRRKQRYQGTTTMTIHDDSQYWEVGGSDVRRILIDTHNGKRPVRPPTDHFKRLPEEACPNHGYSSGTSSRTMA